MTPREEGLVARALLADPAQVNRSWKEKRWAELAALVRYARRDLLLEYRSGLGSPDRASSRPALSSSAAVGIWRELHGYLP